MADVTIDSSEHMNNPKREMDVLDAEIHNNSCDVEDAGSTRPDDQADPVKVTQTRDSQTSNSSITAQEITLASQVQKVPDELGIQQADGFKDSVEQDNTVDEFMDTETDKVSETPSKLSATVLEIASANQTKEAPDELIIQQADSSRDNIEQGNTLDELMDTGQQADPQNEEYIPHIVYRFEETAPPRQVTGSWKEFEGRPENFLKGCKWSPDGSCLLTNSDDNVLRIFNLPHELYRQYDEITTEMSSVLSMQEGETVYDYCWYPYMSSYDPDTCCLLSTCRDNPVHMWDAFTGGLRCSYRSYNNMDEITTATSCAFNLDGSKIYCGFNKLVRVFDTNRPGRECNERPTIVKKHGQGGLISCFAFTPELYALGSYSKSVGIYSESDGEQICLLQGQVGGVTHVMFSPDGTKLYSGGRKDDEVLCWDVRNPGSVLYRLIRSVATNQRIYFDMDRRGRYLASGNVDGTITVWDTTASPVFEDGSGEPVLSPVCSYVAHGDCVNGISFHPSLPLLATASGQRKFPLPKDQDEDSDEETAGQGEDSTGDNSVRVWRVD